MKINKLLFTLFLTAFLTFPALCLDVKNGDVVCCYGDTIFGIGHYQMGCCWLYYDGLKNTGLKIKHLRVARAWLLAKDYVKTYKQNVVPRKANIILLNFGQSDVIRKTPVADYQKAMRDLVKLIKSEKKTPVIVSILPLGENPNSKNNKKIAEYNVFLKKLAAEQKCEYWDVYNPLLAESAKLRKVYPKWKGSFFMPTGHLLNPAGNRLVGTFLLKKTGLSAKQIADSAAKWDKRKLGMTVNLPVSTAIRLIDIANEKGMTDSEYVSKIISEMK